MNQEPTQGHEELATDGEPEVEGQRGPVDLQPWKQLPNAGEAAAGEEQHAAGAEHPVGMGTVKRMIRKIRRMSPKWHLIT
jgi:hypothetical protein